jgi:hypothetical protein
VRVFPEEPYDAKLLPEEVLRRPEPLPPRMAMEDAVDRVEEANSPEELAFLFRPYRACRIFIPIPGALPRA